MKKNIKFKIFKLIFGNLFWLGIFSWSLYWTSDIELIRMFAIMIFIMLIITQTLFVFVTNPIFEEE